MSTLSATKTLTFFPSPKPEVKLPKSSAQKPRHKFANAKGGMILHDDGNIIHAAAKDILNKIKNKLMKLQLSDLLKTSGPALIHSGYSFLDLAGRDMT